MAVLTLSPIRRLLLVISISFCFFATEISVGFYTHSLALIADAFHYLNDLVSFVVALIAIMISRKSSHPREFTFGWQRATPLGAFFNGVFLAALGLSIFLQAIERFVAIQEIKNPRLVFIIGAVGLGLNIISAMFLHDHGHENTASDSSREIQSEHPLSTLEAVRRTQNATAQALHASHHHVTNPVTEQKRQDIGLAGVFLHIMGDAVNNIGVMISAIAIWTGTTHGRYYADPAVSVGIALMITLSSIPLIKNSGGILLQGGPPDLSISDIKSDLEELPQVLSVHELHVWRLDQEKTIATLHVVTQHDQMSKFIEQAKQIGECLHAYGVHSFTVQPELRQPNLAIEDSESTLQIARTSTNHAVDDAYVSEFQVHRELSCQIKCPDGECEKSRCCD